MKSFVSFGFIFGKDFIIVGLLSKIFSFDFGEPNYSDVMLFTGVSIIWMCIVMRIIYKRGENEQ